MITTNASTDSLTRGEVGQRRISSEGEIVGVPIQIIPSQQQHTRSAPQRSEECEQ